MRSSIKINSISIDLAGAPKEFDMAKCDHFSIRGFVAEMRAKDPIKCWPFSKESAVLGQSYIHSPLDVQNFRWWRCMSCVRDTDADGTTKDCGLHSNSRSIVSGKELDGSSSVIPSQRKLNSLTVIDEEKERNSNVAGNAVVENEDACNAVVENEGASNAVVENEDASNAVVENEDANCEISQKDDQRGNAVVENEDVNCEISQKDDQRATTSLKKSHPQSMDASTVRNKSRKVARPAQIGKKRSKAVKPSRGTSRRKGKRKVNQLAVTTFASSEIAGVVEDTPPKATKNRKNSRVPMESDNVSSESMNLAISGWQRKKARKVRRMTDLLGSTETKVSGGDNNTGKEESSSKKESGRGRKRKLVPAYNYASRKLSTARATSKKASKSFDSDQGDSDSGYERDPIMGKQKNRRFQVADEFVQEGVPENDADPGKSALPTPVPSLLKEKDPVPSPPSAKRTGKKLISLARKKKHKSVTDNRKSRLLKIGSGKEEGNQVKPPTGPSINASSQPTGDSLNEKRGDSLLDDELASEGYIRKPIPQVNDKPVLSLQMPDNDQMRSRDAEANCVREIGSSSKSNTVGWLTTGVDAVDFRSNNNCTLRITSSSTEVADRSSVPQKDASDGKGKKIMLQEHQGALGSQTHDKKENMPEEQNDDIPMEIAEILANTLHEISPSDKEEDVSNKQPPQETPQKSKNALLIDLNETYDNGTSPEENNTSRPPKPCDTNAARKEVQFPIGNQKQSLDFFQRNQPYMPSPFGMFPPTQENRASSIRFSAQNSQWIGNVPHMANQHPSPSSYGVLRPCNTWQSVPNQYRERPRPIWTSSMIPPQCHPNPVPFNMDQSTRLRMLSQAPSNGNTCNLNFVGANGNQRCGPNSEFSFGYRHGAGVNSIRSMDAFSSDSSAALKLLSIMDPRVRSNTPADHHGNTSFTKRHFPPVNQSKELIELQTGESSKTAYPTKQLPFDLYSNGFAPESSRKSFPIVPPFGTSSFSFPNAQAPWSHHQAKNAIRTDAIVPVYSSHETPVFPSSNEQGRFQLLGASNSMKLPLKPHMTDKEMNQNGKAESCSKVSALPPKNSSGSIVCSVNRNPADFTIPEPGNVYMLTGDNLKVRKRAPYKKRASLCKQDALKQTKKPAGPSTENA